jgi:hypothetical protein
VPTFALAYKFKIASFNIKQIFGVQSFVLAFKITNFKIASFIMQTYSESSFAHAIKINSSTTIRNAKKGCSSCRDPPIDSVRVSKINR